MAETEHEVIVATQSEHTIEQKLNMWSRVKKSFVYCLLHTVLKQCSIEHSIAMSEQHSKPKACGAKNISMLNSYSLTLGGAQSKTVKNQDLNTSYSKN